MMSAGLTLMNAIHMPLVPTTSSVATHAIADLDTLMKLVMAGPVPISTNVKLEIMPSVPMIKFVSTHLEVTPVSSTLNLHLKAQARRTHRVHRPANLINAIKF